MLAQGIALDIHSFYTGIERIFEAIAHSVDQNVPAGSEWHKNLLEQMTVESSKVRPSVISQSVFSRLDELRRFRHVVRSNYGHKLEIERVLKLADELSACY